MKKSYAVLMDRAEEKKLINLNVEQRTVTGSENTHYHGHLELVRVKKGSCRLFLNSVPATFTVHCGDCVLINASDIHAFHFYSTEIQRLSFPLSYVTSLGNEFKYASFVVPNTTLEENPEKKFLVDAIFSSLEANCDENGRDEYADGLNKGLCTALCSIVFGFYDKRRTVATLHAADNRSCRSENVSDETIKKFNRVKEYISENYGNSSINLSMLSKKFGINRTFLSALFPRLVGCGYMEYIHELRINHAIELMYEKSGSISEIAYACGFETVQSFYNVFKTLNDGAIPSAFISALRGKPSRSAAVNLEIHALGKNIFNYNWRSNSQVAFEFSTKENAVHVKTDNVTSQIWCHLKTRMLFSPGQTYRVSYKAKALCNSMGEHNEKQIINCCFIFFDGEKNNIFHLPKLEKTELLPEENGFCRVAAEYTVPTYYKPSTNDFFSIYSDPYRDLGLGYIVKDISVEKA